MTAFYPAKLVFQLPVIAVGRHDWTIGVFNDDGEVRIIPQWRFPGGAWMMPSDLKTGFPAAALCALLEPENLLMLAQVIEKP